MGVQRGQHGIGNPADAELQGRSIVDQRRDQAGDLLFDRPRLVDVVGREGPLDLDRGLDQET
ncbi:MAG: hypothetical protein R2849_21065 [Thermomicrobiales bacterium]